MTAKDINPIDAAGRVIVSSRVLDVPRAAVFDAWTDPVRLARWWGPKGFTNTFHEFDPKPGGHWRFIMHGPDGIDYPNHSVFEEITKPLKIVFQHESTPTFKATVTFDDLGGTTLLTWRMEFKTTAECEKLKTFITEKNQENLDRLEGVLAKAG